MTSLSEWFRKIGHRLCKTQVQDKFLLPQLARSLEASDARLFKKLVQRGRLAPFYPGHEEQNAEATLMECPICCVYYNVMNKTKCCGQRICSECIAQIKIGCPFSGSTCPFCKKPGLDVEISTGKSESELQEDMLDEKRFQEYRLRHLAESACTDAALTQHSNSVESEPPDSPSHQTIEPVPQSAPPHQANFTHLHPAPTLDLNPPNRAPTPSTPSTNDVPRQENSPLRNRVSNLSNVELQQCEDYIGVCPEDLGLDLDEFNELLLQQILMTSAIEDERAVDERTESDVDPDQGGSTSTPNLDEGSSSPSLRSHSLPDHTLHEDNSPNAQAAIANRWSFERVLERISTTPFSLLGHLSSEGISGTTTGGYPETSESTSALPRAVSLDDIASSNRSGSSSSLSSSNEGWKAFLNSIRGFRDVQAQFRMIRVEFDDETIDSAYRGRTAEFVCEEMSVAENPSKKNTAVMNPDGTFSVVSVPVDIEQEKNDSNPDAAVIEAVAKSDRSQVDAISAADERLRQLYNRPH